MSDKVRHILIFLLIVIFCVAAVFFGKSMLEYHKGEQIYESAKEFVTEESLSAEMIEEVIAEAETSPEPTEKKKPLTAPISTVIRTHSDIDFNGLQQINPDILGWIQIANTQVDYPLVNASDNQFYLNHTYDKRKSSYGSIFLEPLNSADLSQAHVVIYGHNMVNKSMFGSLLGYKQQGYWDTHKTITICLPGKDLKYQVFSAYTAHVNSPTYRIGFSSGESFWEMIAHMKENSVISTDISPKVGQQILTLSTCTPAGDKEHRFVVNAVLVSENHTFDKIEESVPVVDDSPIISRRNL